jgi:hypothetical protein
MWKLSEGRRQAESETWVSPALRLLVIFRKMTACALILGYFLMAVTPTAAISEGVPSDDIRLFVATRLPDEAKSIFKEMIVKEDTSHVITSFESDLSSSDIALFIVLEWDDLLHMPGISGGNDMFSTATRLGPAANVVKLLIRDKDSRQIGAILYRLGDGSIEKYQCIAHDLFKRIRNERVISVLAWKRCA